MEIVNASLAAVAVKKEQYPESALPEIAFIGKSNVGKSSLINAMLNRKALARTSNTPGKTRTINFYNADDRVMFVDLPGYGYAKLSKQEYEKWGKMIEGYLKHRAQLKLLLLLVDIRHSPGQHDLQMLEWVRYHNRPFAVVATKSDKIGRTKLASYVNTIRNAMDLSADDFLLPFSSESKEGRDALWEKIHELSGFKDLTQI